MFEYHQWPCVTTVGKIREAGGDVRSEPGAEPESVGERGPRGPLVGQNHDSAVIRAELDLVLGEDHPVRPLSA